MMASIHERRIPRSVTDGKDMGSEAATRLPLLHPDRFPALQSRNFRLLWIRQGISGIGSMMQVWAVNWQLYALTHSKLSLGMVGLFRVVPIVLFSLFAGTVADAWDRRKVMLVTQSTVALVAAGLGWLTWSHHLTAAWIYAATVVGGAAMAFDNPSRQALIPSLIDRKDLPNAMSVMSVSFRTSTIIGPMLAGLLIAHNGLAATYFLNALSFLAVIWALLAMRIAPVEATAADKAERGQVSWASLMEGLRFVRGEPLLVSTIWLDFFATFFSSANSLLPVFASDILHVGAKGYGVLAAAEAVGALVSGIAVSFLPTIRRQGPIMLASVLLYGVATIVFGASHFFLLSWLALAGVGATDTVSTIFRQTIRQLRTPDRLRGRMTSVNMIFFMGGPQLGEFESGLAAQWLGGPAAVVLGGIACVATVGLVVLRFPILRHYRFDPAVSAEAPAATPVAAESTPSLAEAAPSDNS
jgi:MFS family permease